MPEDGPPYKRPRGKSPRGKKWDAQEGKWVNQRTAGAAGSSKDAVAVHGVGASTALVVYVGGAGGGGTRRSGRKRGPPEQADGNTHQGVDASHPLGTLEEPVAAGRCTAVALVKLRVYPSVEKAVAALDAERDDWTSLRTDFRTDAFLGTRGYSWHRQIIYRAILAAGFDYKITRVLEMNNHDAYLVDGVANDRYLVGKEWVQPYERDSSLDNPRDNPSNWQHVVAIVKGKIRRKYTDANEDMACLHLDAEGTPDPVKGFFIQIDTVYRVTRRAAESASRTEAEGAVEGAAQSALPPAPPAPAPASLAPAGTRVRVFWESDRKWYYGKIHSTSSRRGHCIAYDTVPGEDDLVQWHDLAEERWEVEAPPSGAAGRSGR